MRSLLFVPGDSERMLAKAAGAGADALIIDLEDSVSSERKPMARDLATEYLGSCSERGAAWVRVNDRGSGELLKDMAAVGSGGAPGGWGRGRPPKSWGRGGGRGARRHRATKDPWAPRHRGRRALS